MKRKVITDTTDKQILVKVNGEQFGIVRKKKPQHTTDIIILDTREAKEIVDFIQEGINDNHT